jgi:diguanylate cyclase (GGDEF)-like protein
VAAGLPSPPTQGLEVWAPVSTPVQVAAVIAATAFTAEIIYRLLRCRFPTRRNAAVIAAARLARHDGLTGLGNRLALREAVTDEAGRPTAVIIVNLDQSQTFIYRFGHRAFDQFLVLTAARVAHCASEAGGTAFRLRRDEFAVVVQNPAGVSDLAARLVGAVAEPTEFHIYGHHPTLTVTACAGVTTVTPRGPDDARQALVRADSALHAAKKQIGRGRVATFEPARCCTAPTGVRVPPLAPGEAGKGTTR